MNTQKLCRFQWWANCCCWWIILYYCWSSLIHSCCRWKTRVVKAVRVGLIRLLRFGSFELFKPYDLELQAALAGAACASHITQLAVLDDGSWPDELERRWDSSTQKINRHSPRRTTKRIKIPVKESKTVTLGKRHRDPGHSWSLHRTRNDLQEELRDSSYLNGLAGIPSGISDVENLEAKELERAIRSFFRSRFTGLPPALLYDSREATRGLDWALSNVAVRCTAVEVRSRSGSAAAVENSRVSNCSNSGRIREDSKLVRLAETECENLAGCASERLQNQSMRMPRTKSHIVLSLNTKQQGRRARSRPDRHWKQSAWLFSAAPAVPGIRPSATIVDWAPGVI